MEPPKDLKDLMEQLLAGKCKLTGPGGLAGQGTRQLLIPFFKTLESYTMLGENMTLMLDAESDFFRYLQSTTLR